eukprot:205891_1
MMNVSESIFVSVVSYRDIECQWTVKSAFEQASHPEKIHFGICFQYNPDADQKCLEYEFHKDPTTASRVRVIWMQHTEARGPCYARHLAQSLWKGESFVLSIDSHTRFVKGWDVQLIDMLRRCQQLSGHPRTVLSTYPPDFPEKSSDFEGSSDRPTVLCATEFDKDHMPRFKGRRLKAVPADPIRGFFIAAGFVFASSDILSEVPYDPNLKNLFFGEEISLAARLFTHGWDAYAPPRTVAFHKWDRSYRPTFWELFDGEGMRDMQLRAQARVRNLLGIPHPPNISKKFRDSVTTEAFGLGYARPLIEFCEKSGLNFASMNVSESAKSAGLNESQFYGEEQKHNFELVMKLLGERDIAV